MEELPRRARSRRRLLLGGPRHGDSRRRARAGCWSSTRSTGPARRWPASSRRACRSRRRRSTASRRWPTSRSAAWSRSSPARASSRCRAAGSSRRRASPRRRASSGCSGPTASAAVRRSPTTIVLEELIDGSSVAGGHLRPRLGDLRHDPARHRSARRLRRAGPADDRGGRLGPGRVRAGRARRDPQQLPLRPGGCGADPRGGRARSSPTRAGRASPTARCSAPATSFRCRACARRTAELHGAIVAALDAGIERLRAAGPPPA